MASVLVVAGRVFLNLVVLALTTMRCWCLSLEKHSRSTQFANYSSQITALSRSAVRSMDRPIDAVAVRCYEEEVDGNCSSQSRGIQLPAARRAAVARHEEKKEMSTYKVKAGDTLWGIAQSQCGDGSVWPKIYHENRWIIGNNPNLIHPGQVLNIDCPPPGGIWYTVEPGDNLTLIAEKVCGNENWEKIYKENKAVIGGNPNLIHPGQVLHIVC